MKRMKKLCIGARFPNYSLIENLINCSGNSGAKTWWPIEPKQVISKAWCIVTKISVSKIIVLRRGYNRAIMMLLFIITQCCDCILFFFNKISSFCDNAKAGPLHYVTPSTNKLFANPCPHRREEKKAFILCLPGLSCQFSGENICFLVQGPSCALGEVHGMDRRANGVCDTREIWTWVRCTRDVAVKQNPEAKSQWCGKYTWLCDQLVYQLFSKQYVPSSNSLLHRYKLLLIFCIECIGCNYKGDLGPE